MLARLDADKDGAVSKEEFAAAGRGRGERTPGISAEALRRFDTNGDGKVTRDEFPGGGERFDRLDRNKDGALTAEDFPADGAPPTPPVTPTPKGVVEANDKDGNGRLSRNEFPGSDEDWRALDKDQDGWITPAEAAAR
jgi:Ca2+-binding EF-hand superfamily protein